MPERPFICITSATLYDEGLNSVSIAAELLLKRMDQCSDRYGTFSADPRIIFGECCALRPDDYPIEVINRCLGELAAAGAIKFCARGSRRWIQIAEHLRYHQDAVSKPRWGDAESPQQQTELPMATEMNLPMQKPSRAQSRNKMIEENTNRESNNKSDSGAPNKTPPPLEMVNNSPASETDSETRAVSAGYDSAEVPRLNFSLPPDDPPTERPKKRDRSEEDMIILQVRKLAGDRESVENGGNWRTRFRSHPVEIKEALGELQLRLLNTRDGPVRNRGAWLTDKFDELTGKKQRAAA